jgi:hypothetical protein
MKNSSLLQASASIVLRTTGFALDKRQKLIMSSDTLCCKEVLFGGHFNANYIQGSYIVLEMFPFPTL